MIDRLVHHHGGVLPGFLLERVVETQRFFLPPLQQRRGVQMRQYVGYFKHYSKALVQCAGRQRQISIRSSSCRAGGLLGGEQFSVEQLEPVQAPFVPVRVIAGPGSGKTRVIVGRIAHILNENPNDAGKILAVSFTNKAAGEMKRRVSERISQSLASKILFGTFHSFCYKMLKLYGEFGDWNVMDQDGCQRLMEGLVREHLPSLDTKEVQMTSRSLLSQIKMMKTSVGYIDPKDLEDIVGDFFGHATLEMVQDLIFWTRMYEDSLRKQKAVDFDDLLGMCLYMLERDEMVRSKLQTRFKHVLVDEFQDVNAIQYRLLQQLCPGPHAHVFVVGDVDQAIYSWRGACVDLMQTVFERDYERSLTFKLEDNYRTRKSILDGAQQLINLVQNSQRGVFKAVRDGNRNDVSIHKYKDPIQEGRYIADDVQRRLSENPQEQLAILLRTHSQATCIESALTSSNIPYIMVGGMSFWKRAEVMDILAYLKVALNSCDQIAFTRVINTPKRGIGPSALHKLEEYAAHSVRLTPSEMIIVTDDDDFNSMQQHAKLGSKVWLAVQGFRGIILNIRATFGTNMPLDEIIDHIIRVSGYIEYLEGKNDSRKLERLENIRELVCQARMFHQAASAQGANTVVVRRFLDHIAMNSAEDDSDLIHSNASNPVAISTMHAAKGLEFDHVYVPGLNDGLVPLSPPKDKVKDTWAHMEEETRLLFVAVTRAKDSLLLSYTQEPLTKDARSRRRPQLAKSRFLSCFERSVYRDFSGVT